MTVIYIMASSHSGSTLLSFLLGAHPKVFNIGELKEFESFFNPYKENDRGQFNSACDCGINVYDCPFWSKIKRKYELKSDSIKLYNEIRVNVKEPVLVDNSKIPEKIEYYRKNNIPYLIVHLVRDGRARAYSEQKLGRNYKYALRKWGERNFYIRSNYSDNPNYMVVYYENLVNNPLQALQKILGSVNLVAIPEQLNYQNKEFHSIGGNKNVRFNRPEIKFDSDYLRSLTDNQWDMAEHVAGESLTFFGFI